MKRKEFGFKSCADVNRQATSYTITYRDVEFLRPIPPSYLIGSSFVFNKMERIVVSTRTDTHISPSGHAIRFASIRREKHGQDMALLKGDAQN